MTAGKQDPSTEQVVVVDEENRVIGSATRKRMRRENLIHRATFLFVLNSAGELFVQQRTTGKDVYPGYYEVAAGGVVNAGESYDAAAARELEEELGIRGVDLQRQFDFFWQDDGNRVWGRVYLCRYDGPMQLQEEEVQWGAFLPLERVREMMERQSWTPDGIVAFHRLFPQGNSTMWL